MNKMVKWSLVVACAFVSAATVKAQGDGGPLIDALVKKGVLSSQEGEEIRADMTADLAATPGGMISWGSSAVRGVKIYGDARFRYEYNSTRSQNTAQPNEAEDHRYRYRLRVGADYIFAENWSAGIRAETQADTTSTNTNLGGFGDKTGDELRIGLAYLSYANKDVWGFIDSFKFTAGKQVQPFYVNGVNGFVWDTDNNPEGFSQDLAWEDVATEGLDISLRGLQFVASNVPNSTTVGGKDPADAWGFGIQTELKYEWASKTGFKIAPTFLGFQNDDAGAQDAAGALRQDLTDSNFLLIPAEVYFNVFNNPLKIYSTYGYNVSGGDRNNLLAVERNATAKNQLFNVGATYGSARNKGTWDITAEYRYVESNAYTRNLQDSDFNGGRGNSHGPVASFGYAFTDNIQARATYFHAMNIDKTQAALPAGSIAQAVGSSADVLQIDLSWRF
jgi:hypothetical protein